MSAQAGGTGGATYRIGEVAQRLGISTRTLRYYQELGLLDPADHRPGGTRRYSEAEVARVERILELRSVMGFDLERIATILAAEDRIAELRGEVHEGVSQSRRREIVEEAIALNDRMQMQVRDRLSLLEAFLDELEAKQVRYREVAAELAAETPSPPA